MGTKIQFPAKAVDATGDDISPSLAELLRQLQLLASADDIEKAGGLVSVFTGPPQSVALIEAGATALSKWWSVVLGGAVGATWVSVKHFWGDQDNSIRMVTLGAAAFVTAAFVLAIGWIIGSDVRGRAAAMTATIQSRADVAIEFLQQTCSAYVPDAAADTSQITPLPRPLHASYITKAGAGELGWRAVAVRSLASGDILYLVVKGRESEWAKSGDLDFVDN